MSLSVEIAVEAGSWARVPDAEGWIRRSAVAAAAAVGLDFGRQLEISVLLCDDDAIRVLNRDWRAEDKPTNVLSFPSADKGASTGPRLLGDLAIAIETVEREASALDKPVETHLAHLVVHGVLHLLDYDHLNDTEASAMEALETTILRRLDIADPYADTEPERLAP